MILGLHGKMGAGKNECARRLAKLSPLPVVEVSFAAKLKESAAALLNVTVADLDLWKNDPSKRVALGGIYDGLGFQPLDRDKVLTVRSFLQRYGTEAHRDVFATDFWLDAALPLAGKYDDALYVVTDMRFANERQRVTDLGGLTATVVGPNKDTGNHPSEKHIRTDVWITNTIRDDGYSSLDFQLRRLLRGMTEEIAA